MAVYRVIVKFVVLHVVALVVMVVVWCIGAHLFRGVLGVESNRPIACPSSGCASFLPAAKPTGHRIVRVVVVVLLLLLLGGFFHLSKLILEVLFNRCVNMFFLWYIQFLGVFN